MPRNGNILGFSSRFRTGALKIYDGKCHHICFTWKSTSGEYKFYVDGKNVTSGVGLAKGLAITGNGTLVLGQNRPKTRNNAKLSYYGKMDDVNIWNKALPESEILKISKCGGSKAGNVKSWSDFKIKDNSYLKVIQNVCPENC